MKMDNRVAEDKREIQEIVDQWVIFSDSGDWDRFAALWHEDGWMSATWFQAPAAEFIKARREGWEKGVSIIHFQGAHTSDVVGNRAIAQTKMTIGQRASVDGVLSDVLCTGRFYDFFEKREGKWGLVRRQPIYEKDRMDPVDPSAKIELDQKILDRFPEGYKHLAYLQTKMGYKVKEKGMPGMKGPEVEQLYAEGRAWLKGSLTPGSPC
jgi:hypothetical protein